MIAFLVGVAQALGAAAEEKEIALQHAAEADAQLQQLKHQVPLPLIYPLGFCCALFCFVVVVWCAPIY